MVQLGILSSVCILMMLCTLPLLLILWFFRKKRKSIYKFYYYLFAIPVTGLLFLIFILNFSPKVFVLEKKLFKNEIVEYVVINPLGCSYLLANNKRVDMTYNIDCCYLINNTKTMLKLKSVYYKPTKIFNNLTSNNSSIKDLARDIPDDISLINVKSYGIEISSDFPDFINGEAPSSILIKGKSDGQKDVKRFYLEYNPYEM
jgi:hypothetical protein